jgi:hypothetical protein
MLTFKYRLIPIISVTTPSALTIAIAPINPVPSILFRVPNIDFHSLNFANILSTKGTFSYKGPHYTVDKIVAATAAQGYILPLAPPAPNSSWVLDFVSPSITCTDLQGSAFNAIKNNIQAAVEINRCHIAFGFIAWTPKWTNIDIGNGSTTDELYTLPFILSNTTYSFQGESLGPFTRSPNPRMPATLYAAVFPSMVNEDQTDDGETWATGCAGENPVPNITAIQCGLQNVSYHASFSLMNGEQTISITQGDTPYNSVAAIDTLSPELPEWTATIDTNDNDNVIGYSPAIVQNLAYQAVMDSFGKIIVGTISNSMASDGGLITNDTSVMSTILGDTQELAWLNNFPPTLTLQQEVTIGKGRCWGDASFVP